MIITHYCLDENKPSHDLSLPVVPKLDWNWLVSQMMNGSIRPREALCIDCGVEPKTEGRNICIQCNRKRKREAYRASGKTTVESRKKK